MGSVDQATYDFDIILIGAGISGINTAYHIQTKLPAYSYTILENRNAIGGTWDLFRYPGIRSDSDLHTFGFAWRPWEKNEALADGTSIREYVKESAEQYGIDKNIRFQHRLLAADWSSVEQRWRLSVDADGEKAIFRARFVVFCTGYYDYNEPRKAPIPGIENFQGQVIHPQFWPEDLDYSDKRLIIIGSGATAITLLPNLTAKAAHVTMLQRSPSYILSIPAVDQDTLFMRRWFPKWMAALYLRWKLIVIPAFFFNFCRAYPKQAREFIRKNNEASGLKDVAQASDFNPTYGPWEQRLCMCPDGDFFKALRGGNADIVTDHIETVTTKGIETKGGRTIPADIIITATGLKMQFGGGAKMSVDGRSINFSDQYFWRTAMMQGVPNAAFIFGYTNASWTLGAETTAMIICRMVKHLEANRLSSAIPTVDGAMTATKLMDLSSTYVETAKGAIPKAGNRAPWMRRSHYMWDYWYARFGSLTKGMQFTKSPVSV